MQLTKPAARRRMLTLAGVAAMLSGTAAAGPEKIQFPADWASWERYGSVDRYDTKQYRELYAQPDIVKAVRAGKPVPDGATLAMAIYAAKVDAQGNPEKDVDGRFVKGSLATVMVMQKRTGYGTEYPPQWRNGDWEYAAFLGDGKPNEKANANIKACFACHKPHEKQDYVISLASLAGKFPSAPVAKKTGMLDVNIANFVFGPARAATTAGKPITWTNTDDSPHQISIEGKNQRTAVLLKGESAALTFTEPGIYNYICSLHPGMKGQVEVK